MAYSESPFSSTSSSYRRRPNYDVYDVFLSSGAGGSRKQFTDHLYLALCEAGIRTFKYDDEIRREEIYPQILRAIEGSRISVVVFSRSYASSTWCLDQLVKIIECRQKTQQVVLPIFYDTDPSDVRNQTGSYARAFDEHEERFKEEMEKVNRWREALAQAANLPGWVLKNETNEYEAAFIKRVVNDIACILGNKTRIEMTRLKSGRTDAISASEQEQNNVDMAQQREPLFTGEFERANDLTGAGIELPRDTPDELKKLKGSKSRDMLDDFESGWTDAISASEQEQNNVEMAQQREPLFTEEFERANDLTGARIELPPDTADDQEPLFLALDSVHHVDRSVPPTIDENYNRREATERLVQPGVGASSFGVYGNHNAISTSQQEQNNEVDNLIVDGARIHEKSLEEITQWLLSDDVDNGTGGGAQPGAGASSSGGLRHNPSETLLMTNLILEFASAVFDQLGYALVGMVFAFVALLLSTAELIYMERMARRESRSPSPWKPVGTIVEYFGLVGAVWQCFYSIVEYAYARQKRDNPIKMSLLPFLFLSCVVISILIKKRYIDKSA